MTTSNPCRAKIPSNCRVHGSQSAVGVVTNHIVAYANLRYSTKAVDFATTLEDLSEAKQLVAHDQLAYDATLAGQKELKDKLLKGGYALPMSESLEYKIRLKEAKAYREETLSQNPAHIESEANFLAITENATQSFTNLKKTGYREIVASLKDLPYGTPVAIKTKNGDYLYDGAGNGRIQSLNGKKTIADRILGQGHFMSAVNNNADDSYGAYVSLQHSNTSFPLREIESIHVLPSTTSFEAVGNTHAVAQTSKIDHHARWVQKGEGYYYEIEGEEEQGSLSGRGYLRGGGEFVVNAHNPEATYEIKN